MLIENEMQMAEFEESILGTDWYVFCAWSLGLALMLSRAHLLNCRFRDEPLAVCKEPKMKISELLLCT